MIRKCLKPGILIPALVLVLAVVAAACGGDDATALPLLPVGECQTQVEEGRAAPDRSERKQKGCEARCRPSR